ncbi:MAG: WbuC family cupin fold metalloprotein [Pseudomonadota bacterium]
MTVPQKPGIHRIARKDLEALLRDAAQSPRRRARALVHESHDDPVQRLAIAALKGAYFRPHAHPDQWEVLAILGGAGRVLHFAPDGQLEDTTPLSAIDNAIVQIPTGSFHGFVVTDETAIVLEIKPGPYRPNAFSDWSPNENEPHATAYRDWMMTARPGDRGPA